MKLRLPTDFLTDAGAAFELDHGAFAGKSFTARLLICTNPACDCREISFDCAPASDRVFGAPASSDRPYFTLALASRQVAASDPANATPEGDTLASVFVSEMADTDWQVLDRLYRTVKRSQTEDMALDEIHAPFPEEALKDPTLLIAYCNIFPHASTFDVTHKATKWLALDSYCANPSCTCTSVHFEFLPFSNDSGAMYAEEATLFYDYRTATVEPVEPARRGNTKVREVLRALCENRPDLNSVLAERQRQLRYLYARRRRELAAQSNAPRTASAKPGRNDPCPCGSGRKYKKCCGAAVR